MGPILKTYETNLRRAAGGLCLGGIAGAALVTLYIVQIEGGHPRNILSFFTFSAFVWAVGLVLVAPLPWFILHSNRMRGWQVAVALGAVLTFIVALGLTTGGFGLLNFAGIGSADTTNTPSWIDAPPTLEAWMESIQAAALCSAAGVVVAFVIWRTAYRRSR